MTQILAWLDQIIVKDLRDFSGETLGWLAVFSLTCLLFVVLATRPAFKNQQPNLILGALLSLVLLVIFFHVPSERWYWTLVFIPPLLVAHHAIFLWLSRPRSRNGHEPGEPGAISPAGMGPTLASRERMERLVRSYFSLRTLLIRFAMPAVLLWITGFVLVRVLVSPATAFNLLGQARGSDTDNLVSPDDVRMLVHGVRFGAVGAYVFILGDLGRRTFQHDITAGSAMWCVVTLMLGPILAAVIALVWRMSPPEGGSWWQDGVVLFFTGLAPRRVLVAVEAAATKLLQMGPETVVENRLVPLSRIGGMAAQIQERLGEEGILDVNGLANAEPVRLVRNTRYDMRQIVSWIDEAILIVTLPRGWEKLEELGITGAIDLVWYLRLVQQRDGTPIPTADGKAPAEIEAMAAKIELQADALISVMRRLNEDVQVQQIWALYFTFVENDSDTDDEPMQRGRGAKSS